MKGFTLIEMIVATVILLLFTGGSILTMNNFNDRQKAIGVRSEIKSMIELAKNYASTMQYPAASLETPEYYQFFIQDKKAEILVHFSSDTEGKFGSNDRDFNDQGVEINNVTVCFKPFETVQYDCGVGTTAAKTIVVTSGGAAYSLIVDEYGKITEVNP